MEERIFTFENDSIKITYDAKRCIHAAECVKGLKKVFDPDKRPWIQPEHEEAENIAEVVQHCPTGALHYEAKDENLENERTPAMNTVSVTPDGPIYFKGDIEIQAHDGSVIKRDSRFALCRCGKSGNKPACDNSHKNIPFSAPAHIPRKTFEDETFQKDDGKLILKVLKDGPILVEGNYQIYSETSQPVKSSKNIALCRCGGSSNKPFCDGTHKKIGFEHDSTQN
ncbi:CDGSH iron-sulfur domain-containing protein [Aliifodinibius sp. S!AR15-10]|uniref:CDGSH iron-sulfur domain-containing protein n=1 Tax=Aliifodinibius sp. S!AR15-10 TaxID=2950437 RepID=UPI002854ED66|nr:CDGSH iron-sulfur domain-containing protein [Aliifodinibius sp. S!AR15-10]MDR8392487.1 CDGSH iron-sulfur domain-containing protein [Aliifodinibius sp. S!AR15-10]